MLGLLTKSIISSNDTKSLGLPDLLPLLGDYRQFQLSNGENQMITPAELSVVFVVHSLLFILEVL